MANWTQTNSIQYKPYVAVNPVQAMTEVGIAREQELQLGVQKVNSYFEQIGGLDIARDLDKQYVQQRLGDLKTGITKNLSGDFSDQRIINQIGGAATTIYKDPQVQRAVVSTGAIRKGYADIDAAKKAGKSNPNNEAYYNSKVSRYTQSQDPEDSFNDSYIPYTDITGKMMEVAAKVGVDVKYVDHILNKNGDPMAIMTTEEFETNMPKIKAAAELLFQDGNVRQQLAVDGWAKYKDYDVAQIYNPFVDKFNERGQQLTEEKMAATALLTSNATAEEKAKYEAQLKQLNLEEDNLKADFAQLKQLATTNPDRFKEYLHETDYKTHLINMFSTEKSKTKYSDSPLTKVVQWQEEMKFNVQKEKNDNYYKAQNLGISISKENREQQQFEADYPLDPTTGRRVKVSTEGKKSKLPTDPNKATTKADNITDQAEYIARMEESFANQDNALTSSALDIFTDYLNLTNNSNLTKEQAKAQADGWAKNTGETTETYLKRFASQTATKLEEQGTAAPAQLQAKLNSYTNAFKTFNTELLFRNEAEQELQKDPAYKAAMSSLPASITIQGTWNALSPNTPSITLNKADLLNATLHLKNHNTVMGSAEEKLLGKRAKDALIAKFGQKGFDKIHENLIGQKSTTNEGRLSELVQPALNNIPGVVKAIKSKYEKLSPIIPVSDNMNTTPEDQKVSKQRLIGLLSGNTALSGPDYDREAMTAAASQDNSVISTRLEPPTFVGDQWKGTVYVTDPKTGKKHGVNLNQNDLEAINDQTFQPYTRTAAEITIAGSAYKSTSLTVPSYHKDAYSTAFYTTKDFSKDVQNSQYIVKANIDKLQGGGAALILYAKDKKIPNSEFKIISVVNSNTKGNPITELETEIPLITPGDIKTYLLPKK